MSPLAALAAMIVCIAAASFARAAAQINGRLGEEHKAITNYLRSAAYVGATIAFGIAALWAVIL